MRCDAAVVTGKILFIRFFASINTRPGKRNRLTLLLEFVREAGAFARSTPRG